MRSGSDGANLQSCSLTCTVKISDFPRLKIAMSGDLVLVKGRIVRVDGRNIALGDAHLEFPDPPPALEASPPQAGSNVNP
jgi:hypothetical protein